MTSSNMPYQSRIFKGCLPQIFPGLFLNGPHVVLMYFLICTFGICSFYVELIVEAKIMIK